MKLSFQVATLLLAVPALVAAAPAAEPASADVVTATATFFAREATCNAPRPTDADKLADYNKKMKEMSDATIAAHAGENKCKPGNFISSKNKNEKERIKKACVDGYGDCVTNRKKANNACKSAGGTVDQGHKDALKFCQDKKKEWSAKKI